MPEPDLGEPKPNRLLGWAGLGGLKPAQLALLVISLLLDMNLTFWCRLEGMVPAVCIHRRPNSKLKAMGMSTYERNLKLAWTHQYPQVNLSQCQSFSPIEGSNHHNVWSDERVVNTDVTQGYHWADI